MDELKLEAKRRSIPIVLANSEIFKDLSEKKKKYFLGRLRYIEEICLKSRAWVRDHKYFESTGDFIDEVEQDILINLSGEANDRVVTPWVIHTSWTILSAPESMLSCLPSCLTDECNVKTIGFTCDEHDFLEWAEKQSDCLEETLDNFYGSESYESAVGSLIGIDICLGNMLPGFSKQRLNKNFDT